MLQRLICGLKLNNVSPTKKYTKVSCKTDSQDATNIDNISFTFIRVPKDFLKQQRIIKNNKVQPKIINNTKIINKTKKKKRKNRFALLLKFVNCLKC